MSRDLPTEVFLVLRESLFNTDGTPVPFYLRAKGTRQDDPLDEHLYKLLAQRLQPLLCLKAPGPLTSPDMVILDKDLCATATRAGLRDNLTCIFGLEVKKVERARHGIARPSGIDYNTTPPCGTIRVYDAKDQPLDIRGFYLFVCLEEVDTQNVQVTALALCDGNLLNEDFELYTSITGQREKSVELGTYGNGANRQRPMLIFANPLGWKDLDNKATLIHSRPDLELTYPLRKVYTVNRTAHKARTVRTFYCYRFAHDVPDNWIPVTVSDPFPVPTARQVVTSPRGRFRLTGIKIASE